MDTLSRKRQRGFPATASEDMVTFALTMIDRSVGHKHHCRQQDPSGESSGLCNSEQKAYSHNFACLYKRSTKHAKTAIPGSGKPGNVPPDDLLKKEAPLSRSKQLGLPKKLQLISAIKIFSPC
jgi:hypothetical protein